MGLVYRPPIVTNEINSSIGQDINRAARYSQVRVVGYFNYRNVDWSFTVKQRNFLRSFRINVYNKQS